MAKSAAAQPLPAGRSAVVAHAAVSRERPRNRYQRLVDVAPESVAVQVTTVPKGAGDRIEAVRDTIRPPLASGWTLADRLELVPARTMGTTKPKTRSRRSIKTYISFPVTSNPALNLEIRSARAPAYGVARAPTRRAVHIPALLEDFVG